MHRNCFAVLRICDNDESPNRLRFLATIFAPGITFDPSDLMMIMVRRQKTLFVLRIIEGAFFTSLRAL